MLRPLLYRPTPTLPGIAVDIERTPVLRGWTWSMLAGPYWVVVVLCYRLSIAGYSSRTLT